MAWTTDQLLADMKRKANLPAGSNVKFTDAQILRIAFEVLLSQVDPTLLLLHEEYDTVREDFAITSNDGTYRLPERCISGTVRQVLLVQSDGRPYPLARIGPSDAWQYEGTGVTASQPAGYVLEGDVVRLLPVPSSSGLTLRFVYRRRPASFVLTTACALVGTVGATTLVTTGGTWSASQSVDVVRARPPLGVLVQGATATYLAGTFTFDAGVLDDVQVGDYVCAADTTCVVPLPERFYVLLLDLATAQLCQEWGNVEDADRLRATVDAYVDTLKLAQSNRASAQPQLAVGTSTLRGGRFGFGGRFR
jgi:hypothetical protein